MNQIDPTYFQGLGRVVVAAAGLDFALALAVFGANPNNNADLQEIASTPGRPLGDAKRLGSQFPRGALFSTFRELTREAQAVLDERNRVTHAVYLSGEGDEDGAWRMIHLRSWFLSGSATPAPLPTFDELEDLAQRIHNVAADVLCWVSDYAEYERGLGST